MSIARKTVLALLAVVACTAAQDIPRVNLGGSLHILTSANVNLKATGNEVAIVEDTENDASLKVDPMESNMNDVKNLAESLQLTDSQVEAAVRFQTELTEGPFARVIEKYSKYVSRMWFEKLPDMKLTVEFTMQDTSRIKELLAKELPNGIPKGVEIQGGGRFNIAQHTQRSEDVAALLRKAGYRNFMTQFDVSENKIKVEMVVNDGARELTKDTLDKLLASPIFARMRYRQRRAEAADGELSKDNAFGRLIPILGDEVIVEVKAGSGEIYELEHSRGGNWMRDDGFRECTSGWAVRGPNGDGIVTAAHCVGLNQFEEEGGLVYATTWRSQERDRGDAEYHTTSHIEPAEFFARAGEIRDVNSIKSTFWMLPGSVVCEYGRSNNVRTCDHFVLWNSVTATFTDGVTVRNLCRVTGDDSIGGDSGGGWSWGNTAWGVHSGSNGDTSLFTPVQRVQSELGVTIKT